MDVRQPCPTTGRLPASLKVKYGAAALLGRFFLAADTAARDLGVTLHFASLDDLIAANEANRETWRPLMPIFNPSLGGATENCAFAILGRNGAGEVVATQAARFYEWDATSFDAEATTLRMFFADPQAARERGDSCVVTAPSASKISGRVVFSGGGWYRPDFRGRGLATIIPRISRAFAYTHWRTDFTISMMADAVIAGGMADRTGYTNVEYSSVDFCLAPLGAVRCAFVWMETAQLFSDLEATLDALTAPVAERPAVAVP
ncbi:hypothetical protein AU467_24045 [Mesorhizobium loti]|uniref:N-acetyltransferase domain-containing protein n=1 Tax=Rhizobium loti TaxID=381 RepID=A0A101KSB9_RHILI|nr:hypothetical protein AU467_24045 [Mesorhizobium loti]